MTTNPMSRLVRRVFPGRNPLATYGDRIEGAVLALGVVVAFLAVPVAGAVGSEAYVASLSPAERSRISAMLNFDMIGSPNFVRFVYDGDLSDSDPPEGGAPAASADIEQLFLDYFGMLRRRAALSKWEKLKRDYPELRRTVSPEVIADHHEGEESL